MQQMWYTKVKQMNESQQNAQFFSETAGENQLITNQSGRRLITARFTRFIHEVSVSTHSH